MNGTVATDDVDVAVCGRCKTRYVRPIQRARFTRLCGLCKARLGVGTTVRALREAFPGKLVYDIEGRPSS
jgi:hypothetical protein